MPRHLYIFWLKFVALYCILYSRIAYSLLLRYTKAIYESRTGAVEGGLHMDLLGSRGFLVLVLEPGKLMVVYPISLVDHRAFRRSRITTSGTLRNTYGYSPFFVENFDDSAQNIDAAMPGVSIGDFTVCLDSFMPGGAPVKGRSSFSCSEP